MLIDLGRFAGRASTVKSILLLNGDALLTLREPVYW